MFRFADGCDSYAAGADIIKKWGTLASPWTWNSTAGRNGGGALQAVTTGGGALRTKDNWLTTIPNSGTSLYVAFWVKISASPASTAAIINIVSDSATFGAIRLDTSGRLCFWGSGGSVGATGPYSICDNVWHWVVIQFYHNTGTQFQNAYVDGSVYYGQNVANSGNYSSNIQYIELVSVASQTITFDDIIIWDSTGSGMTSSSYPLGPQQITTLRPTGDSSVQFTRSTGSDSYALIDEVNADVTDYVESGTSGHQDLYDYGNLGFTPSSVMAVVLNAYLSNPNAGTISYQQSAKSSATTVQGTSTVAPSQPRTHQSIFLTDPNGGGAWAGSAVDAATFGIKVV